MENLIKQNRLLKELVELLGIPEDCFGNRLEHVYNLKKQIAALDGQIEKPEMYIAKSGRKYRHIPVDMDIETWDAMTPVQRLEYKGLLRNEPVFKSEGKEALQSNNLKGEK